MLASQPIQFPNWPWLLHKSSQTNQKRIQTFLSNFFFRQPETIGKRQRRQGRKGQRPKNYCVLIRQNSRPAYADRLKVFSDNFSPWRQRLFPIPSANRKNLPALPTVWEDFGCSYRHYNFFRSGVWWLYRWTILQSSAKSCTLQEKRGGVPCRR